MKSNVALCLAVLALGSACSKSSSSPASSPAPGALTQMEPTAPSPLSLYQESFSQVALVCDLGATDSDQIGLSDTLTTISSADVYPDFVTTDGGSSDDASTFSSPSGKTTASIDVYLDRNSLTAIESTSADGTVEYTPGVHITGTIKLTTSDGLTTGEQYDQVLSTADTANVLAAESSRANGSAAMYCRLETTPLPAAPAASK